ncbi:hypothetical protein QUF50_03880 [Thiotrichales bacterium HSG1]|nr:hypothetical protein [Thiotrichales bacterium HSG1]
MNNLEKKDSDDWIDVLSGKEVPDANSETIREAQALRMELKFRKAQDLPTESIQPNPRILQNIFKETELKPNQKKQNNFLRSLLAWKVTLPLPSLVTAMLLVGIIPVTIMSIKPVEPIEPIVGIPKSLPQILTVPNPQTIAGELIFGLTKLGLTVNIVESSGTWIIEVKDSSIADSIVLETLLKKYGLLSMSNHLEIHIVTK